MPWPQLPSADDVFNDILLFFKVCLTIAVLFILGVIGKAVWFDKTEMGKAMIAREKEKQVEDQKKELERKQRELERLKKELGQ